MLLGMRGRLPVGFRLYQFPLQIIRAYYLRVTNADERRGRLLFDGPRPVSREYLNIFAENNGIPNRLILHRKPC